MPSMRNPRDIYLSSEDYIAVLESKLKKLTAPPNKPPSSRDMMRSLAQSKESRMKALTDESSSPYIRNHDFVAEEEETRMAAIQRRLHPERQALNPEERKYLLENDELGKLVHEMVSEEHVHAEKEWKRRLSHPNIHQKLPEEDQPGKERPDHPEGTESGDPGAQGADKPGEEVECGAEGKPPDTDTEAPV